MAKIAFLLLCHKNGPRVLEQARVLTSRGDCIAIHIDAGAPDDFYDQVAQGTADNPNVVMTKRLKCGWGTWSLVAATLNMIRAADKAFPDATHFFLISGDCMPIKPAHVIHNALDAEDHDQIEHADFFSDNWIKTGMKADRVIYRHWFNERTNRGLFYVALRLQRALGLTRKIPKGVRIRIGSQWWVLRRKTVERVLEFIDQRPDVLRFFRTTWIPDETFFQTLVMQTVPKEEVISHPPTFLMFSDYGMPVTFYADHFDLLRRQSPLFARKISGNDEGLRKSLGALFLSDTEAVTQEDNGHALYDYVRKRGRSGRRLSARAWEAGTRLGPDYALTLIVCKKWHIGQRIASALRQATGRAAFGYVFDEDAPSLPDLGGIERTREKRNRHRRTVLRLIAEAEDTKQIAICLDPANRDAIEDLARDGCELRVLEVETAITDEWLAGHATRMGLGQFDSSGDANLLLTLRENIAEEQTALQDMHLPHHARIHETATPGELARPIAAALGIPVDAGAAIARTDPLFE